MNAPADGYNSSCRQLVSVDQPFMYKELSYDPKEFMTVAQVAVAPLFLATAQACRSRPCRSSSITPSRSRKDQLWLLGIGTAHHLSMEAIKAALKLDMVHVPFRGAGQIGAGVVWRARRCAVIGLSLVERSSGKEAGDHPGDNGAKRWPNCRCAAVAEFIPGFDFASRIGIFARANALTRLCSGSRRKHRGNARTRHNERFAAVGIEATV